MPARPPSEPPQGGWHCLLPLRAAGMSPYPPCACYFSNTAWIISQAMPTEDGERASSGPLLMAPLNRTPITHLAWHGDARLSDLSHL